MDYSAPTHDPRISQRKTSGLKSPSAKLGPATPDLDAIEDLQLHRLAGAVLSKSPADMAALSEANPDLFWEWIEAFALKKREADAEYRLWSAAIACLSTAATADNHCRGRRPNPRTAAAE